MYKQRTDIESAETKLLLNDVPPSVRSGFVCKVYGLVSFQLVLTFGWMLFASLHEGMRFFVLENQGLLLMSGILGLVLICPTMSYQDKYPHNLLLLFGFTLCETYSLGAVGAVYTSQSHGSLLLCSFALSIGIFVSLSLFMQVTKRDMTFIEGSLTSGMFILIGMGLILEFLPHLALGSVIFSGCGVALFVGYILYDTSTMLHYMTPDDAIAAAIQLYLDVLNLFLCILQLMNGSDD